MIKVKPNPQNNNGYIDQCQVTGICPLCGVSGIFQAISTTEPLSIERLQPKSVILAYVCAACHQAFPLQHHHYHVVRSGSSLTVQIHSAGLNFDTIVRSSEPFDYSHVPDSVKACIGEALDCLSVSSYHGFAALCRRTLQVVAEDRGAKSTSKVKKQVEEMSELLELDDETKAIALQIMLDGHDGAHPHLPPMNAERARILLEMLKALIHDLYTKPGNLRAALDARGASIENSREELHTDGREDG